jgi:hypothetical protein
MSAKSINAVEHTLIDQHKRLSGLLEDTRDEIRNHQSAIWDLTPKRDRLTKSLEEISEFLNERGHNL